MHKKWELSPGTKTCKISLEEYTNKLETFGLHTFTTKIVFRTFFETPYTIFCPLDQIGMCVCWEKRYCFNKYFQVEAMHTCTENIICLCIRYKITVLYFFIFSYSSAYLTPNFFTRNVHAHYGIRNIIASLLGAVRGYHCRLPPAVVRMNHERLPRNYCDTIVDDITRSEYGMRCSLTILSHILQENIAFPIVWHKLACFFCTDG
jgi:hypothetical protein